MTCLCDRQNETQFSQHLIDHMYLKNSFHQQKQAFDVCDIKHVMVHNSRSFCHQIQKNILVIDFTFGESQGLYNFLSEDI